MDKSSGVVRLVRKVETIEDVVQRDLKKILESGAGDVPVKTLQEFKKRKLISESLVLLYKVNYMLWYVLI